VKRSLKHFLLGFEMAIFKMHNTFFVFLRCTIEDGQNVDVFLIAFLQLWMKFLDGIDKY